MGLLGLFCSFSGVSEFRVGQAAELLGVSADTLRRWVDDGRIEATRTDGGHRVIAGTEIARLAIELAETPEVPQTAAHSVRNRLTGIVTRVTKDTVMAQVELQAGPYRLVSLISREAADELGLEPGVLAVATMKSTNVAVERPAE